MNENTKSFSDMTKQERFNMLRVVEKILDSKYGEVSVYLPSICAGPMDISVSSILLMIHNELRLMKCRQRPYAE